MIQKLKPGDRIKSDYSDAVLVFQSFDGNYAILEVEKTGLRIKANKLHLNGTNKFKKLISE